MVMSQTPQIKVDLRHYPEFFEQMRIAALKYGGQRKCSTAKELLEVEFHLKVDVMPHDMFGVVIMDGPSYTWFNMRWS